MKNKLKKVGWVLISLLALAIGILFESFGVYMIVNPTDASVLLHKSFDVGVIVLGGEIAPITVICEPLMIIIGIFETLIGVFLIGGSFFIICDVERN